MLSAVLDMPAAMSVGRTWQRVVRRAGLGHPVVEIN